MSARLVERREGDLVWLSAEGRGWRAVFSTRLGGVSQSPYDALNLSLLVGDDPRRVLANRERLLATLGLTLDDLVVPAQVHGVRVRRVDRSDAGRGARDQAEAVPATDGLLTTAPGVAMLVSTADCLPVLLAGETPGHEPVLALVHAGWRGLLAGVVREAADALTRIGDLRAAVVGPSIGPCCFAVGDVVGEQLERRFPGVWREGRVDLWAAAAQELAAAGLAPAGIVIARVCTGCDRRFFSHRRDLGRTGRQAAVAWISTGGDGEGRNKLVDVQEGREDGMRQKEDVSES